MEAKMIMKGIGPRDQVDHHNQVMDDNNNNIDTEEEECEKKKKGRSPSSSRPNAVAAPPSCQAERCGADLSEAKRYHRRHKVCDLHSKAPLVLVAGLRQRFCQQCSRFHELSEFDEAKRSCRRRLAGHNERRRKISVECYGEASTATKVTSKETNQCNNGSDGTKWNTATQYKPYQMR